MLGPIRLPNDAFKKNAHTEVTTDIVILRKRLPGELPQGPSWKTIAEITNSVGETIALNEYFAAHPEMMLGEMGLEGRMYQRNEPTLAGNGKDLSEQLSQAIALLPEGVYQPLYNQLRAPMAEQVFPVSEHIKPNAYTLINDQIGFRDGDQIRMVEGLSPARIQRIRGMIQVRDAVRSCLRAQIETADESDLEFTRLRLNQAYDRFVSRFGCISERSNTLAFRGDPDLPLMLSLEHYDEHSKRASKAAIFRERTVQRGLRLVEINTAQDALLVTLGERGWVDLDHVVGLLHRPQSELLSDLRGAIFLNPQTNKWETEDEYLSGKMRVKLAVAEAAALTDDEFKANVAALRLVQPADLAASEIDARLGSAWIPTRVSSSPRAKLCRRHAGHGAEGAGEGALIVETAGQRDVGDGLFRLAQQSRGGGDAGLGDELTGRQSEESFH